MKNTLKKKTERIDNNQVSKRDSLVINMLLYIPSVFGKLVKLLLDDIISVLIAQGSRSSGKTTLLYYMVMLYVLLFPKGDVILYRSYKSEHFLDNAGKDRFLNLCSQWKWLFPGLGDFKFTNKEKGSIVRTLKNGEEQKIIFAGIKNKGLDKSKSTTPITRYVSFVGIDEAEDNSGVIDIISQEALKQEIRDIQITFSRREGEFKNLDKYPRTKFMYSFNPKTINGLFDEIVDEYLPDDEAELFDKGFQLAVLPWYENGNGMAIFKNNIYMLMNDKKEFHPVQTDINTAEYFRVHFPKIWKTDFLGIRKISDTALFRDYIDIMDMSDGIPQNYIPMYVGVDQGIQDISAMVVRAQTYGVPDNNLKIIVPLDKYCFPVFNMEINGKKSLSVENKSEHIKSIAVVFIDALVEGFILDSEWRAFYEHTPLSVQGMTKDTWLLDAMMRYLHKKYPQFSSLVEFTEIKETTTSYNLENEIKLMRESILNLEQGISYELTPRIIKAYKLITTDNWKDNHFDLLNLRDADRYANFKFLTK